MDAMTANQAPAPDFALSEEQGVPLDFSALPIVLMGDDSSVQAGTGFSTPSSDNGLDVLNQTENADISFGEGGAGEAGVTLSEGDVFDLASLGKTLFITGDDSPETGQEPLVLGDAWNSGGTVTEGGVTFHSYMATVAGQTVTINVEQGLGITLNHQDG